ncbi:hypothetical protein HG531_009502 [Fusarium graminearum]|nr:hypothetical protein HG531_009502 [Fusarium graminearum]
MERHVSLISLTLDLLLASEEKVDNGFGDGVVRDEAIHGITLDSSEEVGYPWVVFLLVEAIKGRGKDQLACNVKEEKVDPVNDVDGLSDLGLLTETLEKHVGVRLDNDFLLNKGLIVECRPKLAPVASMVDLVGTKDTQAIARENVLRILGELIFLASHCIDLEPSNTSINGKTVWTNANNRAILAM